MTEGYQPLKQFLTLCGTEARSLIKPEDKLTYLVGISHGFTDFEQSINSTVYIIFRSSHKEHMMFIDSSEVFESDDIEELAQLFVSTSLIEYRRFHE
jgi:hypothetical protein